MSLLCVWADVFSGVKGGDGGVAIGAAALGWRVQGSAKWAGKQHEILRSNMFNNY